MSEQRNRAWAECIALWHEMSIMDDTHSIRRIDEFKNNILMRIGIGKRDLGCPFCEVYYDKSDCPLGDCERARKIIDMKPCFKTPFYDWSECYIDKKYHNKEFAKKFYDYLVDLKIKEDENNI